MALRRLGLEAFVLAYLLRRDGQGATVEELARALETAAKQGILANGLDASRLRVELEDYLEYLKAIKAVEEKGGRIILRESRISPLLRRVLEEAMELVDMVTARRHELRVAVEATA